MYILTMFNSLKLISFNFKMKKINTKQFFFHSNMINFSLVNLDAFTCVFSVCVYNIQYFKIYFIKINFIQFL